MLSMLLALSAFAAEPTSFELAQFHARRGEWTQARVAVNAALTADAQDYEAHHLNAVIHRQLGETGLLVATTAAWRAEQDGVAANVAHAAALAVDENGDCDQVAQLLEGLPEEPALAYVGKRIEWEAARHCDIDRQSVRAALKAQTSDLASARTYSLSLRVEDPIDKAVLTEIASLTGSRTGVASLARRLWDKDRKVTGKLKAARKLLLAQAGAMSGSESMVELHHAAEIYRRAQHPDAEATSARLEKLAGVPVRQPSTAVLISVYEANRKPTHELALAALDALTESVQGDADATEALAYFRAQRLTELDRPDEAHEVLKAQVLAMEKPGSTGNFWAYSATENGKDLDVALTIIDKVIADSSAERWTGNDGDYAGWAEAKGQTLANYHDTRGWVLYGLERYEDAVGSLQIATGQEGSGGVEFAHLGLSHAALGQSEEALAILGIAVAKGIEDATTEEAAHAALEPLFESHGPWHAEGFGGYLRDLAEQPTAAQDEDGEEEVHSLIGKPLPVLSATNMDGPDLDLHHDGVLIVDVWATWCGPCVTAMPGLQEVSKTYADRGVRVVGLSVDEKQSSVTKFFKEAGVDYELGWISDSGFETFDIEGIPALFVVGPDGAVAEYISGYSPGDTRLEEAIEGLLGSD